MAAPSAAMPKTSTRQKPLPMPVAKLTPDDDFSGESAEDNGDGQLEEDEVYPRVTAAGLPVRGALEDSFSDLEPGPGLQQLELEQGHKVLPALGVSGDDTFTTQAGAEPTAALLVKDEEEVFEAEVDCKTDPEATAAEEGGEGGSEAEVGRGRELEAPGAEEFDVTAAEDLAESADQISVVALDKQGADDGANSVEIQAGREMELMAILRRQDADWEGGIGGRDEEEEEEEEEDGSVMERSPDSAAMVHGADASAGGSGSSVQPRAAGLGQAGPSLEPAAPRSRRGGGGAGAAPSPPASQAAEAHAHTNGVASHLQEDSREQQLQAIRVKFLRLVYRLGKTAQDRVVAQVLYRLGLAEQLRGGRSGSGIGGFSFDRAKAIAEEQEAGGQGEVDFSCTILLLGRSGVGKSATINSIFGEVKTGTDAFGPATLKVQEVVGCVHGIKVRVIDTPGLLPAASDQRQNEKLLSDVKRYIKKAPPDVVLYFDRLDMPSYGYGDLPLLRTITDKFGPAIWFNAIVVLTHAASAPPEGPDGVPLIYEMLVNQRSAVVQQTLRQAARDMRLMHPVSLVENHSACRMNRTGDKVLPNGQIWKTQLLLLCFASKILAEANSLLLLQENGSAHRSGQGGPSLPVLLSSLLQQVQQVRLPDEHGGNEEESDDEVEDDSDEEDEYDQLPPFRRLKNEEILELDQQQRKDYFQELEDRERLFEKKQWREELRRRKGLKNSRAAAPEQQVQETIDDEGGRPGAVAMPLPDMVLPPSFDSDYPTHRYRSLETPPTQWLVRPVLDTHGWDHDTGYDGVSVEKGFIVQNRFRGQLSGQVAKDKKEAHLKMECIASFRHGEGAVTLSGLDVNTLGNHVAYTLRSETSFSNFKQNKTTGGLVLSFLEDVIAAGLKLENRLLVGKRLRLMVNGGAFTKRGDTAYGGSLEATLRGKDFPYNETVATLGLSVMDWRGQLVIGGNVQSNFPVGKTMLSVRASLNNRSSGQLSIRAISTEQLQMCLVGVIPLLRSLWFHWHPDET